MALRFKCSAKAGERVATVVTKSTSVSSKTAYLPVFVPELEVTNRNLMHSGKDAESESSGDAEIATAFHFRSKPVNLR